ncbi:armadillo/beta-catenin/plakoglobin [Laccaria bicolor S238N-H82]|uniref:Armadillo/beta-catenin/plakoglobin n=1 Tax=Laccaria bicolor (strain S238N-H82 / ATCC MYA-4686) TaxID=486041 RepID=B0DAL3_LACBS|nr:armadillo/beta-catenin/plakoglobin [Laccaria bicolor S238N-H82]EDR08552.1 armadillo/beta-catenin/plakoglobin [Laccaria bicolor S238N-H82]|eukprot:XP_001880777.1 armadillo/beta-catenin/plakoglobin [Laccaria bicolor S238N-H82]
MPDEFIKNELEEQRPSTPPYFQTTRRDELMYLQPRKNTVLVSHGRPPWYGEDGQRTSDAFVIGVAGGSASGKTHVARQIVHKLGSIPTVIILSQDSFYKFHNEEELALAHANLLDFDHPEAIDMPMFAACLADLKACKQSNIPVYSFAEHQRLEEKRYLYGATIIIAEGIMALHDSALRSLYDLKVFVQCDSDLMLARRIKRDVKERARSVEGILDQYLRYVKPSYDNFVRPSSSHADIIVPGSNNEVAIDLICTHIRQQLQERSNCMRQRMAIPHLYLRSKSGTSSPESRLEDLNLAVLPKTPQLEGIFTILRSKETSRQDFIFFVDRLSTILVENALQHLPYLPKTVVTPVGVESHGMKLDADLICGVTIMRSGGALERGFKRVINDVPVGSLLIQSDSKTGEPMLLQVMLPAYVRLRHLAKDTWVFLLDAQIGTGAAAFMAIRILLDHGVQENHIVFVTFIVARGGGISVLRRAFPEVKVLCGAVDDRVQEGWLEGYKGEGNPEGQGRQVWIMQPGMGQIGDRYYL